MGFWAEPLKMRTKPKTEVFCSLLRSRSWWAFDLRLEPSPDTKVRYFQMNSMLIACLSSNDRFLFIFSQIHPKLFAACLLRVTWMNKADTGLALMRCSLWITWQVNRQWQHPMVTAVMGQHQDRQRGRLTGFGECKDLAGESHPWRANRSWTVKRVGSSIRRHILRPEAWESLWVSKWELCLRGEMGKCEKQSWGCNLKCLARHWKQT